MVYGYANGGIDINDMGKVQSFTAASTPLALQSDRVRALYADSKTLTLWIGTDPDPVSGVTEALSSCTTCTGDETDWKLHPVPAVLDINKDQYGRIWAVGDKGAWYQETDGNWIQFSKLPATSLVFDGERTVYFGTYQGLFHASVPKP